MANTATSFLSGLEGRFEFSLCSNPNLPRGLGLGILLNLIPEPQVRNWVRTGFRRFGNQTAASLLPLATIINLYIVLYLSVEIQVVSL